VVPFDGCKPSGGSCLARLGASQARYAHCVLASLGFRSPTETEITTEII
jgi:hypothetical protein